MCCFFTYTSQRKSPVSRDFHSHKRKKPSIKELTFILHLFDLMQCLGCMPVLCIDLNCYISNLKKFLTFLKPTYFFLFQETLLKHLYWQIIRLISSGNSFLITNLILIFSYLFCCCCREQTSSHSSAHSLHLQLFLHMEFITCSAAL